MIFQYPVVSTVAAVATDATQAGTIYCLYSSKPYFAHLWVGSLETKTQKQEQLLTHFSDINCPIHFRRFRGHGYHQILHGHQDSSCSSSTAGKADSFQIGCRLDVRPRGTPTLHHTFTSQYGPTNARYVDHFLDPQRYPRPQANLEANLCGPEHRHPNSNRLPRNGPVLHLLPLRLQRPSVHQLKEHNLYQ